MDQNEFKITFFGDPETLQQLVPILKNQYSVAAFTDPNKGLSTLVDSPCHILIIEVNGKAFDGYELKKKARKIAASNSLIFVSRQKDINTVVACQRQGAQYLFFLPVKENEFKEAMAVLFKRRNYWFDLLHQVSGEKHNE